MFRRSPKKSPNKNYDAIHQKYIQVTADYEDMQIQFQNLKEQFHKVKQEKEACQRQTKVVELRESEMRQKFKGESEATRLRGGHPRGLSHRPQDEREHDLHGRIHT